jgi:caffeoyl-CoA O-methyltransferase
MADSDSRKGHAYNTPAIDAFLREVHVPHDDGLEAAWKAADGDALPAIMVGPQEGKLLELLMRMIGARKVVEVGALAGYSAIHIARGLQEGGMLYSVEYEVEYAEVVRANVAKAGLSDRVQVEVGAGLDVLPTLEHHGPFDAVFIDADKGNYDKYGAWAAANLRSGGLLLGDNAYLFGNLMDESDRAEAMRRFHRDAAASFHSVCAPTPDGLLIGVKR